MNTSAFNLRRLAVMGLFTALAFIAVVFIRIPVVGWLSYEPKDVFLTIAAFLLGPLAGIAMTIAVALLEFITVSQTGAIGLVMNIFSSCLFVCTASLVYHRKRTLSGAIVGLALGAILMTGGMLLWNYLITPMYMNVPRNQVAGMLLPMFLPFNLLKSALNATLTMLLYKSVSSALRATRLMPPTEQPTAAKGRLPVLILSALVLVALAFTWMAWRGII